MAFTIELYKVNDPVDCVNKTIGESTLIKTVTGSPIEEEEILNPSFLIDYYQQLLECNYVYVPLYKRYYYAQVTTENANNIRIDCSVDVLQTYWGEIQEQDFILIRSSNFESPTYVQDTILPVDDERIKHTLNIEFNTIHDSGNRAVATYYMLNTL